MYARPIRSQPHWPSARRQRPHGALQLAARARPGRHVHSAHRRHRCRPLDARIGCDDPRRSALARDSTGTKGPKWAVRSDRIARQSGSANTSRVRGCCSRRGRRTTASARPSSSRPSAKTRSRHNLPPKYSGRCARHRSRRGAEAGAGAERGGRPLPHTRESRDRVRRSRARRNPLPHRRHRRSGAAAIGRLSRVQLCRRRR